MKPYRDGGEMLGDYAAILRGLLPAAAGFVCHGRDGRILWTDLSDRAVVADESYQAALQATLRTAWAEPGSRTPTRVTVGPATAYLMALDGDKPRLDGDQTDDGQAVPGRLGAAGIVVTGSSAGILTGEACAELLQPLLRILVRELDLRLRLRDSYRKLGVQAAEEHLLHLVDKAVHEESDSQRILATILTLCRHYLQVDSAAVFIPDRAVTIVHGRRLDESCMARLFEEACRHTDLPAGEHWATSDVLVVPIVRQPAQSAGQDGRELIGVMALAGWAASTFSRRRRTRVARYVASHISYVTGRDYDALTGLMAWPFFERMLKLAVETRAAGPHTVVYFDVDRLQVANDTFGRETGDEILASFAGLLRREFAGHGVTRVTADRFAVLLLDTAVEVARVHGEAVLAAFRDLEYRRDDNSYRPSASGGIGPVACDPDSPGGPLTMAQVACQAAKDRGRNRLETYESGDASIIQRLDDIQLVGFIRNAIERDRLTLLGQPIVATREGDTKPYFEVLVRLLDEEDQQVSPGDFLSAAERYQLMEELDRWVVGNTLNLLSPYAEELARAKARFAINLSGQTLGSDTFQKFVGELLARTAVPPEIICFEITESVAVANRQRAQTFMRNMRRTGCHFSLDDFGTGLSSFAYLKLFPVDTLKIDGGFIRDITENVVSQSLVAAISEVARVMKLETVAEYVESPEARELLSGLGITWIQGHLFGEPVSLDAQLASLHGIGGPARTQGVRRHSGSRA